MAWTVTLVHFENPLIPGTLFCSRPMMGKRTYVVTISPKAITCETCKRRLLTALDHDPDDAPQEKGVSRGRPKARDNQADRVSSRGYERIAHND